MLQQLLYRGRDRLPGTRAILLAGLGSGLAILGLAALNRYTDAPWLLGSFGASCVLLFGFPQAPFSRPRNLVGGHLLCSAIGLVFLSVLGGSWWSLALACASATMAMLASRTVHPPAGSNPVIIYLMQPGWGFMLFPTLAGVLLLWAASRLFTRFAQAPPP